MKLITETIAFVAKEETIPPTFEPLAKFMIVFFVGLTGVGKSTVVQLLQSGLDFTLLPNRREITDDIIIASLHQEDGEAPYLVTDRVRRFAYTARYRAANPGGMAHALSQLVIDPSRVSSRLVFDGLRGLSEVQHAAAYFPQARFVVLDAPDIVRARRLLKRADTFDSTRIRTSLAGRNIIAGLYAIPGIEAIFTEDQLQQISRSARAAGYSVDEVIEKISIIVEERRNYDSSTARVFLSHRLPPEQVLLVYTEGHSAQSVADQVQAWLQAE